MTLVWIIAAGLAMSAIALVGAVVLVLPRAALSRLLVPLVGLAGGSLIGGAFFSMLPGAVAALGNQLSVYVWVVGGFLTFLVLEQFLHWHHCHRTDHAADRPLGSLVLLADGLHNLIGGFAVGGAFTVDVRLGVVTWIAAAAHEVPQELGDFGVLLHSGWRRGSALAWNFASALLFLVGALAAYGASARFDVAYLLPFAAGNFIYIGAADLVPLIARQARTRDKVTGSVAVACGLCLLLAASLIA